MTTAAVTTWTTEGITLLIEGFENCTWPCDQWTHQAHLVMGVWYVSRHSVEAAGDIIREAIKRYNVSCGGANTATGGYHETITQFYIGYIQHYLEAAGNQSLTDLVNDFCLHHGDKNLPLRYYSKDRLMSVEARFGWLEPDLQPLALAVCG